jgi:hypothetical protein
MIAPTQPRRAKTRLSPGKATVRSATRRIMSVLFGAGRAAPRPQCLDPRRILFHPPTPELPLAALARWHVEALSHARTKLAGFFNILLEADVLLPGQLANPSVQFQ